MTTPSRAGAVVAALDGRLAAMDDLQPGDRVVLRGVVVSDHDGFLMVRVEDAAPHAIPGQYDVVGVFTSALAKAPDEEPA